MRKRKTSIIVLCILSLMFLTTTALAAPSVLQDAGIIKAGGNLLPSAAESMVSDRLGRDDDTYHIRVSGECLEAENAKQQLSADFTSTGVQVHKGAAAWKLSLNGYGYGGALQTLMSAPPQANANRVEYHRGKVTEWYVNGPMGLEQGFTISEAPSQEGKGVLTLALTFSGDLSAAIDDRQDGLTLKQQNGEALLRYSGLTAFDASGKQLQAWMETKGDQLLVRVDEADAVYPITVDPFFQTAKLIASDGAAEDRLGSSVAIDGNTIVVGAPQNNGMLGAAYVFVKSGSQWAQAAKLTVFGGAANDYFGTSVAISGDAIVVGMYGAAYVYVKPASGWASMTATARLTPSDSTAYDYFGTSVAISGDAIVVGAYGAAGGGKAYIFVKPSSGWVNMNETATLTDSDGKGNSFGHAVSISGDTAAVISLPNCGSGCSKSAAYLYEKPAGGWTNMTETAKISSTASGGGDYNWISVSISGDTIVVGAPYYSDGYNYWNQGTAYVFVKPSTGWAQMDPTATLSYSSSVYGDNFGSSVAISGDRIVVGALKGDYSAAAAYVYLKPSSGWANMTETEKLTPSDGAASYFFGSSSAISGATVVVGAFDSQIGANVNQGAAYVFSANLGTVPGPSGLTWDGQYFWTCGNDGMIYQFSSDGLVVNAIPMPDTGHIANYHPDVAWDGQYIWFVNYSDYNAERAVFQLNAQDGSPVKEFRNDWIENAGDDEFGLEYHNGALYLSQGSGYNRLIVLDAGNGNFVRETPLPGWPRGGMTFTKNTQDTALWVGINSSFLAKINPDTGYIYTRLPADSSVTGLAWMDTSLVSIDGSGTLKVYDTSSACNPTITMIQPWSNTFGPMERVEFSWSSECCNSFIVDISATADFSIGRMSFLVGNKTNTVMPLGMARLIPYGKDTYVRIRGFKDGVYSKQSDVRVLKKFAVGNP